ncbi:MAG: exodeoxyribonuclease V subunit alpha [Mariprofundaceae bacterium]|nr:exodeoxyribonuclease V subunit alpha [Mariprofundaceae bacterium]
MSDTSNSLPPLSLAFGDFIARQTEQASDSVLARTAAWLSWSYTQGDVCLDLAEKCEQPWFDGVFMDEDHAPSLDDWRMVLSAGTRCVAAPHDYAPMVLDGNRLYLHRYYHDEGTIAGALLQRMNTSVHCDETVLRSSLSRLFPDVRFVEQQRAVALAANRLFSVIAGGPGTGKTTSLVALLAVLLEQQATLRIAVAAPTGKAAARMMESMQNMQLQLPLDATVRQALPTQAATIHRLLGFDGHRFRHHAERPLACDVLVIDEASMVDVSLMAAIIHALPAHARLILLGDRDQLASVDAGSVLGDITGHGRAINYSPTTHDYLNRIMGDGECTAVDHSSASEHIADCVALLQTSHRFGADSGIAQLAEACNRGDSQTAVSCFDHADDIQLAAGDPDAAAKQAIAAYCACYRQHRNPNDLLHALGQFRLLCAVRQGRFGVESLNRQVARALRAEGLLYGRHGMLQMITRNHPTHHVFNGDLGIIWRDSDGQERLHIRMPDGTLKAFSPAMLPDGEAAWAMTVHKAQGSEFDQVALLLHDDPNHALLTRELLYTAITRARQHFTLYATPEVLTATIERHIQRSSGLAQRLGW